MLDEIQNKQGSFQFWYSTCYERCWYKKNDAHTSECSDRGKGQSRLADNDKLRSRSKSVALGADVAEEGTITLPVKELGRIIRELADMEVSVETADTPKATICTRGSIFNVIGMDSKEFPPLPELEEKKEFVFDRNELVTMLKSVSYAQSVNEERYMLKGVFFQLAEEKLALVATDGRRLAVTKRQNEHQR